MREVNGILTVVPSVSLAVRCALLTSVAALAYENNPGWKLDADGKIAVDGDGNPIWINSTGAEGAIKGDTISNLNAEAKQHRTRAETAEANLAKYKDANGKLVDPDVAVKAVDTVSKLDAKKLIDAGEVDKVREQMRAEFTGQLSEATAKINELTGTNQSLLIDKAFDGSEFIRSRIAVPGDMFRDSFGKNVKVGEDGKLEFYGRDGNRLLSKKSAGEYASGDEAFELLVEQHPAKDTILKPDTGGGSGNGGGGGSRGQGRRMTREEFSALPPAQKAEVGAKQISGEITITD